MSAARDASWSGRRVLVTGASGFTGSHLARALLEAGAAVRVFVRRPEALPADLRASLEVACGDVRDPAAVAQAVAGCEVVYHVAALYRDASSRAQEYWDVNVAGTEHVLAACARHAVRRLVYTSTVGVHGDVAAIPADESAPFNPGDAYQRSKLVAEERVWAWYRATQIHTVVVRPAGIYGPGDLRFLKLFRAIRDCRFIMLGDGQTLFHGVYIDDLVQGYLLAGMRDRAIGETFIISGDRYVTLNELVELVARTMGAPGPRWHLPVWPFYAAGAVCEAVCVPLKINPPLHRRRVGFFTHNRAFTSAKAERLLGYTPQVSLAEGLRRAAEWYQAQGYVRPTNGHMRGSHG